MNGRQIPLPNPCNQDFRNVEPFLGNLFKSFKQGFSKQNLFFNQPEKKPEKKKQQEIYKKEQEQNNQKLEKNNMQNAAYLSQISEIDYNRCYKFAKKNPNLSKEQLLELYLADSTKL